MVWYENFILCLLTYGTLIYHDFKTVCVSKIAFKCSCSQGRIWLENSSVDRCYGKIIIS